MAALAVAMVLEFISMAALAVAMVLPGIVVMAAGVHLYGSPCCSYGAAWLLRWLLEFISMAALAVAMVLEFISMAALAVAMVLLVLLRWPGVHLYGSPCCSYGAAWYCCDGCWSSSLWQPLL